MLRDGKIIAPGDRPLPEHLVGNGNVLEGDCDLDKPRRPCANCNRMFQPTIKRRLLCLYCWQSNRA